MKFTFDWLRQFVDVNITPQELADRLTMAGLEVDAVEEIFAGLGKVKVAEILSVSPHPDADRLVVCQVSVGEEKVQIVCGAPNARAGLFTALALPGAVLPSGMTIKKSKIRGQVSQGMLCSEKDVGISDSHSGIMELTWLHESGADLAQVLQLKDTVIEVDLTPNRPDCASVMGIGRETAAFCGTSLTPPVTAQDIPRLTGENLEFSVTVEHGDCPRYAARLLKNVKIGPSPWWLKKRLLSVGQRPINNVVDVTNFVMLEYGQPLHAFDFKKLRGGAIVVRRARAGETLTTLDNAQRTLDPDMLMICDAERPVAVAGVMGGANSEVDENTTEVLLESACFAPVSVRRTARRLNLATEASYRFERGVDPQLPPIAMERAVRLLCQVAGAEVIADGVDYAAGVKDNEPIKLRVNRTNDLLGYAFKAEEITGMLAAIEIGVKQLSDDTLLVTPPSFRVDLEREIDLIEEVARLKGYNEFPQTMPLVPMSAAWQDQARKLRQDICAAMTALGFYEAINYSFVNPRHLDMLGLAEDDARKRTVQLLNPLAEDQSVLRSMLLPGLLDNVRRNVSYQVADIRLFEIGKCFVPGPGLEQPEESTYLTAVLSGRRLPGAPLLHTGEEKCDIYDVKGVIETLLAGLGFPGIDFDIAREAVEPYCESDTFARVAVQGKALGCFGRIATKVLTDFGIKPDVYFLNLHLDALLAATKNTKQFAQLPKFPSVKWDIAVVVPEQVRVGEMVESILHSGIALIEQVELFDVFRGGAISKGMKSVAIKVTYRSAEQTLDDETVVREHQKIIDILLTRFNGQLREV
ncbi:MAG: phenylalanine--tRNA ligase subunit beta [Proteobacteria bacterium]|nr:phenylalanine--tRNA ligase subunit beta [Pseudomonadota bacterium]MBU4296896.1 phenylalanine--tRNA ligase subunit beta [Pseudomonadota bacterium]MCG2749274.1 phenylalanine--tRNA ligase subunit beta [Desulfobulbaceae bacterium]